VSRMRLCVVSDEISQYLDSALAVCEELGLREVETVAAGAEAAHVLRALPDDCFGLIWDPGNEARVGSSAYPDGYAQVRHRVAHVHVKDADRDGRWCASAPE
jgi:sugar phosphate isomerase/epimerase